MTSLSKRLTTILCVGAVGAHLGAVSLPSSALAQDSPAGSSGSKRFGIRQPGQKPEDKSVESGLWYSSEKVEREAARNGERDHSPELIAYVSSVVNKVSGAYDKDLRLYVMDRPMLNANMAPNGYSEIWTGLMLRAQTEDELAFVLGHEFTHYRNNHSLQSFVTQKETGATMAFVSTALMVVAASAAAGAGSVSAARGVLDATSVVINVAYLGAIAGLFSFSRDLESEADRVGQDLAFHAGYRPDAAPMIWENLLQETAASDFERVRSSPTRASIFQTHPLESERVAALKAGAKRLLGSNPELSDSEWKLRRLAYRAKIRPFLLSWFKDELRRKDYGQVVFLAKRMMADGQDLGALNFVTAEAYRLKGKEASKPEDMAKAIEHYQVALTYPDCPVSAHRSLGDSLLKLDRKGEALKAYQAYLKAAPQAEDAWIVDDQIATLSKG